MKCAICGKEIEKSSYSDCLPPLCGSNCFHVQFWNEVLENPDTLLIKDKDGVITAYTVGEEKRRSPYEFRGFGGARFNIKKNDGTIIETTNLWCRGDVPTDRNVEPNAEFIR